MDGRTQEAAEALANEDARAILCLASREPMSAENLQEEVDVSITTIYRHTDALVDADLLEEETEIRDDGNHYSTFETKVRAATFTVERANVRLDLRYRDDTVDRFGRVWKALGESS